MLKFPFGARRGFSLIEMAIVIIVVAVIIAGVISSSSLIQKFRIFSAQEITLSSPVHGISDVSLWLESSLGQSFKASEANDATALTAWYDVRDSINKDNATQNSSGHYPTYSSSRTINSIPVVNFDGTNGYFNVDGSFLNNANYTIFVLEQRSSNKSGNYFIGDVTNANQTNSNQNLVLGYSANGTVIHSQSSDNNYTSSISSYEQSKDIPRIFTFVSNNSVGKKTYINGLLAATSNDKTFLTNISTLRIGNSYQGKLGEIIIFARALSDEERQSVEDYLGKKWGSKILRTVVGSSGSCVGGVIGNNYCLTNCTVTSALGVTTTTVAGGSGSLTCDTSSHFTGSLPYTCLNGVFNYTGATSCSCDTSNGYVLSGSSCVTSACTGGSVSTITISGVSYKVHTFTSNGALSCPTNRTGQALIVAGGGGGGGEQGGGGGGGGVIFNSSITIGSGSSSITVGNGGTGGSGNPSTGGSGQNSVLTTNGTTYTAIGGGGGGSYFGTKSGLTGGSAGGGSGSSTVATASVYNNDNDPTTFGFNGGNSHGCWAVGGAGGGGAGGVGADIPAGCPGGSLPGAGGIGYASNITTGASNVYYAGGGGGGTYPNTSASTGGAGGSGGGARGGGSTANKQPPNATANTGGGGGGCGWSGHPCTGSNGGSGVVIIRY